MARIRPPRISKVRILHNPLLSIGCPHPFPHSFTTPSHTSTSPYMLSESDKVTQAPRIHPTSQHRIFTMSDFSNANTGGKPADSYTAKNKDGPSLTEKIGDLSTFISSAKFGMMTTHTKDSNLLVLRCMALAATASQHLHPNAPIPLLTSTTPVGIRRHRPDLPHQHRVR